MNNERPLRLAIGGTSLLPPLTGIGRYTRHLVDELALRQHEIDVFYGGHWGDAMSGSHVRKNVWSKNKLLRVLQVQTANIGQHGRILLRAVARRLMKGVLTNPIELSRYLQPVVSQRFHIRTA